MADLITLSRQSVDTMARVADLRRRLLSIEGKLANSLRQEDQSGPRVVRVGRTTTNADHPVYPAPCADTFVVELGAPAFDPTPGDRQLTFVEYDSPFSADNRETRIAHDATGKYWPEGSLVWLQLHHGQWYIVQPPVELLRCLVTESLARCGSASARVLISNGESWCDTYCDITVVDAIGVVCYHCDAQEVRISPVGTACWVKWMDDSKQYEVVSVGEACCATSSSSSSSSSESSSSDDPSTSVDDSSSSSSASSSSSDSSSSDSDSSSSQSESTSASSEPSIPSSSSQSESESVSASEPSVSTSENCLEVVVDATWDPETCEMTLFKKTICGDFTIRD